MNTTFEKYLDTIDKCLKPLPTSERVDIVKEIKGSILEMESENLSTEQILTIAILLISANSRCVEPPFAIVRTYCF